MIRRAVALLALLGLSCAALAVFRPDWATAVGLDLWNLPQLERSLAEEERHSEELKAMDRLLQTRIAAKGEVIAELLAERVTLLEAAARFRHMDAASSECARKSSESYPGRTEGERSCRQVLQWVRVETQNWAPGHAEEVLGRLEAELEAHQAGHDGEVVLTED